MPISRTPFTTDKADPYWLTRQKTDEFAALIAEKIDRIDRMLSPEYYIFENGAAISGAALTQFDLPKTNWWALTFLAGYVANNAIAVSRYLQITAMRMLQPSVIENSWLIASTISPAGASQAFYLNMGIGLPASGSTNVYYAVPLSEVPLEPGIKISIAYLNGQAADVYSIYRMAFKKISAPV